jgi:predicted enzyme related to lactoylglutathione lyase
MPHRAEAPIGAPCWIEIFTSDPDRARRFYGELFGWESESAGPEYGGYLTFTKDGESVAGGMFNDGSGPPDFWTTYMAVEDAAATCAAAKEHGGVVHLEPMVVGPLGSMAMVADPSGAAFGLWQPGEHRGFTVLAEPGAPGWFELHTRDYDAALPFYRDVLGWDLHTTGDTPEFRYTTLGEGDDALAGMMDWSAMLPPGVPSHWVVYFVVEDTDAAVAKATELGGGTAMAPEDTPYGRLAVVTDTTGTAFSLMGPNRAEPAG